MGIYTPLKVGSNQNPSFRNLTMPRKGINRENLPQMMNVEFATIIMNYIPHSYGLEKRKGLAKLFEISGATPLTLLKKFTTNVWIFGYGTTIAAYNTSTDTVTTIKNDFSVNNGFDGVRYGEYFFVCNKVEKIYRIDNSLTPTEVSNAPVCGGLKVIGPRLYAFDIDTDETEVRYSEVDDGSNPPFTGWTISTNADTGGRVNYRNAGTVRSVVQLGAYTVVFCDNGFYSFAITTQEVSGVLVKSEVIQNYTEDFGGARGAIETPVGIFYVNEAGLWQMVSVGQTDVPLSRQQVLTSVLLGSEYFDGVDQSETTIFHDEKQRCVFVSGAKDSQSNNWVLGYKTDLKAFFEIEGWSINRFARDGANMYGASSVKTTAYQLFAGYDDDGFDIGTVYEQEIPLGTLFHAHALSEMYAGGYLTPDTSLVTEFDIYDRKGCYVRNKERYQWQPTCVNSRYDEWASARFGQSQFGGGGTLAGLVSSFGGGSPRINDFQRLIVRVVGGDKSKHILNWITAKTRQKSPIKRRDITQLTN